MDINASTMRTLYTAINTVFNTQLAATTALYTKVAMTVTSGTSANEYPKMDDLPGLREWVGDRVVHGLSAQTYTIKNKTFEGTIGLSRDQIEDDQIGFFNTIVAQFAKQAAEFPDTLVFPLLKDGDKQLCYDGQYFFDSDHPGFDENGKETSVSNFIQGDKPSWYLVDNSQVIKPIVFQKRRDFKLTAMDNLDDPNVFAKNQFQYGVDGRCNAGFGLWQLALKASVELNADNFAKAKAQMTTIRKRSGEVINIRPKKLLVPPSLESAARKLLVADTNDGGGSNIWKNAAEIEIIPYLA